MAMRSLYLASPYGFSAQQREALLPVFVEVLSDLGAEVHEPFSENHQVTFAKDSGWAYQTGQRDMAAVKRCDGLFAIVNGNPPDEGVMVELGAAIALGKPTFLFRDDFRRSNDCEAYPLNLMLFTGLPQDGWEDYVYASIEEIGSPEKALFRWLSAE